MQYSNLLLAPEKRTQKTFLVADMVDSKALARAGWTEEALLRRAGQFFDICAEHLKNLGAERLRLDGDAVRAAFAPDAAHNAINAAIKIHEACQQIDDNQQIPNYGSIGIATGTVIDLSDDYLSMVTILSRHLALAGSALSILACPATVQAASISKISSLVGSRVSRSADEYVGARQSLMLPVAGKPVEYHEIKWDHMAHGLKAKVVSQAIAERQKGT